MARPTKLTAAVRQAIIDGVRAGAHPTVAARAAGIAESTFGGWLRDGRPQFDTFRAEIDEAEAQAEIEAVGQVRRTDPKWLLERRHRERWGKPAETVASAAAAVVAIEPPVSAPPGEVITLTREQLLAISSAFIDAKRAQRGLPPIGDQDLSTLMIAYTPEHPAPDDGDGG
jgi:hypothetical protein